MALIPVAVVNTILVPISLLGRSPSIGAMLLVDFLVILILVLRFAFLFFARSRCRSCGKGRGRDTGRDDRGYPVCKCPACGKEWIL